MWVADKWRDYELLDCTHGERLERWGAFYLVRPDPQVIWDTPREHPAWARADARYRREGGGGHWEAHDLPSHWDVAYGDYRFRVRPMNFKHTGLFPEQAVNWHFLRTRIAKAKRAVRVLNLFAYTGGATVAAAAAGAEVCHVDAARGMVAWARENAVVSGLADRPVRWIVDDCRAFVQREIRRGRRYEALILDPPSYGRGPSGEVWKLEESLFDFLTLCAGVLSDSPLFVLLNAYTTGLAPGALSYLLNSTMTARFGGAAEADELGLPVARTGWILPCGATGRWMPC
jgi:23S rRNA (cytosine1962-C5)-methyltransferase